MIRVWPVRALSVRSAHFHWSRGFIFGAVLASLASVIVYFKCTPPTLEQYQTAVAKARAAEALPLEGAPTAEGVPATEGVITG